MKIHNPNNLDLEHDLARLRSLARGETLDDPVSQARSAVNRRGVREPAAGSGAKVATLPVVKSTALAVADSRALVSAERANEERSERARDPESEMLSAEAREELRRSLLDQRVKLARVIQSCEPLEILNAELLGMPGYPTPEALVAARRRTDLWRLCGLLFAGLALLGVPGWLHPWVAGVSAGILVLLLAFALPSIRRVFLKGQPSHAELNALRKTMEFRAVAHIRMLEGSNGLAWQCQSLRDRRPVLAEKRYERLVQLSRQGMLIKALRNVAAFRLYLQYLLEARQAFGEVKTEFVEVSARLKREFGESA